MIRYIIKRLITIIILVLIVSFLVFALMDLAPGDPVRSLVGENMTEKQIELKREELGYNDPLLVRYGRYVGNVLKGDLGTTLHGNKSVWDEYIGRLPRTLELAVVSIIFVIIISIPFGIVAAVKHDSWIDTILSSIAMCGLSIPSFCLGLMMMLFFGLTLHWLPVSGTDEGFKSIILPAITLGVSNCALSTRITRSSMLDTLGMDYLRTARAKGVDEKYVVCKHALGNALIPIVTIIGSQFCCTFNSAFVIENIFAWPGIGSLTLSAIRNNDATLVTGCVIMTTILTALTLLLVDILYAYIDPRVKASYKQKGGRRHGKQH